MKKIMIIIISFMIGFVICACGAESPAPTPTPTPSPTATPEPERLWLTNQMIEDIKAQGNTGGSIMYVLKIGLGIDVHDIEVVHHEQYDNYTYVFYYQVKYGTPDYQIFTTNLRYTYSAYRDSNSEKGYTLDCHCYEGNTMLW